MKTVQLFSSKMLAWCLVVTIAILSSCQDVQEFSLNPKLKSTNYTTAAVIAPNGYPYCTSASSDPDGDGWGWENGASCYVNKTSDPCGTAPNGYAYCCFSSSDPDGDGWGWENNKSCVVQSGGGSSGSVGCPSSLNCPSGMSCGCYTVSGLGSNKQAYVNAGASVDFLASAMMETELMNTNYAYGDNKTYDSFNAGAAKQNWYMMRNAHPAWRNLGPGDYNTGAQLNSNRSLDVTVYNESRNYYGDKWWAAHRNGQSGLSNPYTQDINNFKAAWQWTKDRINSNAAYKTNDVRFWVSVPAI